MATTCDCVFQWSCCAQRAEAMPWCSRHARVHHQCLQTRNIDAGIGRGGVLMCQQSKPLILFLSFRAIRCWACRPVAKPLRASSRCTEVANTVHVSVGPGRHSASSLAYRNTAMPSVNTRPRKSIRRGTSSWTTPQSRLVRHSQALLHSISVVQHEKQRAISVVQHYNQRITLGSIHRLL